MKKLLCSIFLSMSISAYALFPTNTSTYTIQLDVPNQGDFSDFNFVWHGYEDQFVSYYTVTNQTNYITIAPYYGLFRMSKRVSGGSNLVYVQKGTADITVTGSNAWFSVTHTNIPPNGDYLAQLLLTDTTGTNVIRSLAAGHVRVGSSLWGTNDSMWNFPVNSVWLTNNVALGTIYRVDISTGITAEVTNGTLRLSSTSGNTNGVAASLAAHQGLTSTAHGGIPTTNGLASIAYVDAATNGLSTNGLASLGYVNAATQGLVTAAITNNVLPLDGSKAMTGNLNMGGQNITNVAAIGNTDGSGGGVQIMLGLAGRLYDSANNISVDWQNGRLYGAGPLVFTWTGSYLDFSNTPSRNLIATNFLTRGTLPTHNGTNVLLEGVKIPASTNADYATWANNSSNLTASLTNYFRNAANLTNVTSTAGTATNGTYLRADVAAGVTTLVWQVVDYSTVVTGAQSNAISTVQSSNDLNTAAITTQSNRVVSVSNSMAYVSNLVESCIDTQANNTAAISGLQSTQTTYRAFTLHLTGIGTNDTNSMATYWSSAAPYPSHITNIRWWADGTATGNLLRSSYATAPSAWEDVVFSNLTTAAWAWSNYAVNIAITNGEMLNYYMIGCTNNGCDLMGTKD